VEGDLLLCYFVCSNFKTVLIVIGSERQTKLMTI